MATYIPSARQVAASRSRSSQRHSTAEQHRRAIERVIGAIREPRERNLTLEEMAEVALISPYHFNRIFHKLTGLPPRVFQQAVRMEQAKQLLVGSSMSVTDVCFEVGYNSLGTFSRRFTELVGTNPYAFRKCMSELSGPRCGYRQWRRQHPAAVDREPSWERSARLPPS